MCIEAWRQEGLFLGTASGGGWNDGGAAGQETEPKRHTGHMTSLTGVLRNVHKDNSKSPGGFQLQTNTIRSVGKYVAGDQAGSRRARRRLLQCFRQKIAVA